MEFQELRTMSDDLRKTILELLNGVTLPKKLTAAQAGNIQSTTSDCVGQLMRVGPYTITGTRLSAYDWWVAESAGHTVWRNIDAINAPYLQSVYASIASVTLKAPKLSPVFTGVPLAPTAPPATSTDQLATTAFVASAVASAVASGIAIFPSATPPTNTSVIWRDTNDNTINTWVGGVWVTVN
jgi:hypothetical protein